MILQKELIDNIEVLFSPKDTHYKKFLICIPGGGRTVGASRFNELQEGLCNENIGSVSVNFAGVEGSGGSIELDTLENRVSVTIKIIEWVRNNFTFDKLSLYGVSMGGYIALGAEEKERCNGKIIIHTPAAYAKESQRLSFNEKFTNILRTPNSWRNSESFDWLRKIDNQVLFITHSEDEVIPKEILDKYKNIISEKDNSKALEIKSAKHSIWNNEEINKDFKQQIILEIIDFL